MNTNKRLDWIDCVKGIGITLTVYAHLLPYGILKEYIYGSNIQLFSLYMAFVQLEGHLKGL